MVLLDLLGGPGDYLEVALLDLLGGPGDLLGVLGGPLGWLRGGS